MRVGGLRDRLGRVGLLRLNHDAGDFCSDDVGPLVAVLDAGGGGANDLVWVAGTTFLSVGVVRLATVTGVEPEGDVATDSGFVAGKRWACLASFSGEANVASSLRLTTEVPLAASEAATVRDFLSGSPAVGVP